MRSTPPKASGRSRPTGPNKAFTSWLETCGMTPLQVAKKANCSISAIYNLRNGYFRPGRQLSNAIAEISTSKSKCRVPSSSWDEVG